MKRRGRACQEAARIAAGRDVRSPREAFSFAFQYGWSPNEVIWTEILEDRNSVVHTYKETLAIDLYRRLHGYVEHFAELNKGLHEATGRKC